VFEALRWVERVPHGKVAIFPLLSEWVPPAEGVEHRERDELLAAVGDRLFRAASGVVCEVMVSRDALGGKR
jgi:hypothetical protein